MSGDFSIIAYLQGELRKNPGSEQIKSLIKFYRRQKFLLGSRGNASGNKSASSIGAEIADIKFPESILNIKIGLEIDEVVSHLIKKGYIAKHVDLFRGGELVEISRDTALHEARDGIRSGCLWGNYYAKFKLGTEPNITAEAKMALEDALKLRAQITEFIACHGARLSSGAFTVNRMTDIGGQDNLRDEVKSLRNAECDLLRMISRLAPEAQDDGGRPGNPWKVGFVYGISFSWFEITPRRVSASNNSLFLKYVSEGAKSIPKICPKDEPDWSGYIKTAIKTFGLAEDGRSWRHRPGPRAVGAKPPS